MEFKKFKLAVIALSIILLFLFVFVLEWLWDAETSSKVFVGVEFAYGDVYDCKKLVDRVKNFTNLFVIGLPELTFNQTQLNEICDYIYASGLYFIVMFTNPQSYRTYHPCVWIMKAAERYGEKFLGVYYFDEPGGKQLDGNAGQMVVEAKNYTEAANIYVDYLRAHIEYYTYTNVNVFTSDYGLYWFDYKAGYDVVLAQFGWNHSRPLNVALCRGAANAHNKDWGVVITWTFMNPPYLETGEELYEDLVLAYKAGAKYLVVFSYPKITPYGTLTEEHFEALEKFWNYIHQNPMDHGVYKSEVGYVLPKDFGFGFRGPKDTVWGLWKDSTLAEKIWNYSQDYMQKYQLRLDILYDEKLDSLINSRYKKLIWWNET
ncbi:MAG: hypothetical protein NZ932_05870 [Candidatus Bathyarchaeota archaeon]|nr:hypothetical protein [Candidatus Bathyarchaeota archaeon]MDW8023549.1 hypothetical protein [Nitrososphaerota archaeon]